MEKNKGLFSFRKHPVGDFLDEKEGRKRKGGRLRQSMGFLMAAALIFNTLPASGLAVSASGREAGLCEHHTEHTPDCGYREAQPCTHEHTEECYKTVTECVHTHTDGCYPETGETEESMGEGNATPSDAGNREPSLCTHVCSEESGCITKVLDCHHEHDENCSYQEAQDCGYVCEICNGIELEDTENNAENDAENAGTDTAECICETLCTEDSINGDCPVCGTEDADLSRCKGEKTKEQEKTGEKVITAWEWIDPEEYLTDGMLALPGAGRENPAFVEDVTALLPEKIQAKVVIVNAAENGEETEEDAEAAPETEDAEITLTGWKCASYPEDGAYEGTYTFTAFLPEGFVLAEDAAALEVEVELGGGEMLLRGGESVVYQKAAWDESKSQRWANPATGHSPNFWGRSIGWWFMALVDALDFVPENHPGRADMIGYIRGLAETLPKYQDKAGLWYQVIDQSKRKGNFPEASVTTQCMYAYAKAVNKGYIDAKYRAVAEKALQGLKDKLLVEKQDGTLTLTRCCQVGGLGGHPYRDGSFEYYIGEKMRDNDAKATGPFIMGCLELEK